jgi:hypothetical protein
VTVADVVRPRVEWVPAPATSLGAEAVEFSRRIGMGLDPEQELVLEGALGVRADGRWQTREVGLNVPRQNGKGEVLIARELFGLFELGERLVIHTAHEFKTSAEHFNRLEAVVRESPELHGLVKRNPSGRIVGYRYSHGEESIELQDGRRIEFKTRTKTGMRGFAGVDLLVLDEAMIISESAHSSSMPIIRASKTPRGPQLWYAGSAVDQETMDHGVVWTRVRERGIAGGDQALAYFEWSIDCEHPNDVTDEQMLDVELWKRVNFAIGRGRVTVEHMEWERRAMSQRGFAIELLGAGDYPPTDASQDVLVSVDDWNALEEPDAVLTDPICLAFDVAPDRQTAIVAAGLDDRGRLMVEVVAAGAGTGWVAAKLQELYARWEVVEIVCDGYGPSAAIARRVDEAGITVTRMDSLQFGIACGMFVDAIGESKLVHLGQDEMLASIRGAKARPLVDRWAWSRTKSTVNISPLVAATIAHWSAVEQNVGAPIRIY